MQAIDTNVLIYAEISSSRFHQPARKLLIDLAEGETAWAIPWPCIYEFLRVVTHPRVYHPPVPLPVALEDVHKILQSPALVLLQETPLHADFMEAVLSRSGSIGNLVHDAHIAALCLEHGVTEFITGDRDFFRFQGLKVKNPFSD